MKALFTDLGDVIIYYDTNGFHRALAQYCPVDEKTTREVAKRNLRLAHVGKISARTLIHNIMRETGFMGSLSDFMQVFHGFWRLNPLYVAFLKEWKVNGGKVCLISNIQVESWRYFKKNHPDIRKLFDAVFLSYRMRMIKPDPRIYLQALQETDTKPEDTLFVDDRQENVEAAGRLGMAGWVYRKETHTDFLNFVWSFQKGG